MAEQVFCSMDSAARIAAWMARHAIRVIGNAGWMVELSIFMIGECSLLWLNG